MKKVIDILEWSLKQHIQKLDTLNSEISLTLDRAVAYNTEKKDVVVAIRQLNKAIEQLK